MAPANDQIQEKNIKRCKSLLIEHQNRDLFLDKIEGEDIIEGGTREKPCSIPLKHPFFMAPLERAAQRLSQHIQESNALNRAIQVNLVSEDDDEKEITKEFKLSNAFFRKRIKTDSEKSCNPLINLKNISSSEPPPFPFEFQLQKASHHSFAARSCSSLIIKPILPVLKSSSLNPIESISENAPLAQLIKESYSDIMIEDLKGLIYDRSIGVSNKNIFNSILNDIEINLCSGRPILWIFTGSPGTGKTKLVENISEALDLRLITIDSTQSPRNSKTFETLQSTLSHSTPRSFSQFFSTPKEKQQGTKKQKVAVLFDEVEIAFESDRGYWSALSSFLQSPASRTVPIFITSNSTIDFLETIIKLPDYYKVTVIDERDLRKFAINSDFIGRLHRIDTSIEYEQLALITGYHTTSESTDAICNNSGYYSDFKSLINEAFRWNGLLENIQIGATDIDEFSYAESASLADIFLSVKEKSCEKMNMDHCDNLHSEFFAFDVNDISLITNTLLYSNIPEIYNNVPETSVIARALLEKTIFTFVNDKEVRNNFNYRHQQKWKDLSKKLALRFFDYTKSLQFLNTWTVELSNHVLSIESDYNSFSRSRRKRAYYRYIGDNLSNEILTLNNER